MQEAQKETFVLVITLIIGIVLICWSIYGLRPFIVEMGWLSKQITECCSDSTYTEHEQRQITLNSNQ